MRLLCYCLAYKRARAFDDAPWFVGWGWYREEENDACLVAWRIMEALACYDFFYFHSLQNPSHTMAPTTIRDAWLSDSGSGDAGGSLHTF